MSRAWSVPRPSSVCIAVIGGRDGRASPGLRRYGVINDLSTGWASYAVPRLVSMCQADVIARTAAGGVSEFSTAPYVEHVGARYQQLGVQFAEVVRHWENACSTCGSTNWWYTSASAF